MEIKIVKQIMDWNEDVSRAVRKELAEKQVCLINVMGSPGAGKTNLILRLIEAMKSDYRVGVIEGDIAGQIDAEIMQKLGIPCVQLQTQGACHIEAMSIQHILPLFALEELDVLFVENIGNLVCPAEFDIGEALRIAVLSVPEGDDKVEKYPLMFATSDALVLHKYDMLPYFDFDSRRVEENCLDMNPKAAVFRVSSRTSEGVDALARWTKERVARQLGWDQ